MIVRYDPELAPGLIGQLEAFVTDPASQDYVIGVPDSGQSEALRAVTAYRTMTCGEFDLDALATFRDGWFAFVQSGQP